MPGILVDSNLWIAYWDARHEWHATVSKRLPSIIGRHRLIVPAVIQVEVLHHARRHLDGPAGDALHRWLETDADMPPLDASTVDGAFHLLRDHHLDGIGARDAVIMHHVMSVGARLATADRSLADAAKQAGIHVVHVEV